MGPGDYTVYDKKVKKFVDVEDDDIALIAHLPLLYKRILNSTESHDDGQVAKGKK